MTDAGKRLATTSNYSRRLNAASSASAVVEPDAQFPVDHRTATRTWLCGLHRGPVREGGLSVMTVNISAPPVQRSNPEQAFKTNKLGLVVVPLPSPHPERLHRPRAAARSENTFKTTTACLDF